MLSTVILTICSILLTITYTDSAMAYEWKESDIDAMASRAELTVRKAYKCVWAFREKIMMTDTIHDPKRTGMIGVEYSALTTTMGYENAKELSTEPGWASWLVRDLCKRGLAPRSNVAVSLSGSFPALNIAVFAALQELDADVRAISSVGSSSWGANETGLSWPEMERLLREDKILKIGSSAVTLGGTGDRGAEWDEYAMNLALAAVKTSQLPLMVPRHLEDSVRKRMAFYGSPRDYICFINVGGGHAALGGGAKLRFNEGGWYYDPVKLKGDPNGVMDYFLEAGVPCLNLLFLEELNRRYDIVRSDQE